jgi:hypothetical protein
MAKNSRAPDFNLLGSFKIDILRVNEARWAKRSTRQIRKLKVVSEDLRYDHEFEDYIPKPGSGKYFAFEADEVKEATN